MRRVYTSEFKKQAVQLAESLDSGAQAAKQLGITDTLIYSWKTTLKSDSSLPIKSNTADSEEVKLLRKEVSDLKKVNQILKAAAAFFSQDSLK